MITPIYKILKTFGKIQPVLIRKYLSKLWVAVKLLNLIKGTYQNSAAIIISNDELSVKAGLSGNSKSIFIDFWREDFWEVQILKDFSTQNGYFWNSKAVPLAQGFDHY